MSRNNIIYEADGRTFGRAGEINTHLRNPTGMTVRVPNNNNTQPNQEGAPPPVSVDNNIWLPIPCLLSSSSFDVQFLFAAPFKLERS